MNLYRDSNFTDKFDGSLVSNKFEVTKTGRVGIDTTSNWLYLLSKCARKLFYEFTNVNSNFIESVNKEIVIDNEVEDLIKLIVDSSYDGEFELYNI